MQSDRTTDNPHVFFVNTFEDKARIILCKVYIYILHVCINHNLGEPEQAHIHRYSIPTSRECLYQSIYTTGRIVRVSGKSH